MVHNVCIAVFIKDLNYFDKNYFSFKESKLSIPFFIKIFDYLVKIFLALMENENSLTCSLKSFIF
jgi:hypothetical protein